MARAATPCLTLFRHFSPFGPLAVALDPKTEHSGLVSSVPRHSAEAVGSRDFHKSVSRFRVPVRFRCSAFKGGLRKLSKELGAELLYSPQSERGSWHRPASIPLVEAVGFFAMMSLLKLSLTLVRADAHNAARPLNKTLGSTGEHRD